MAAECTTSLAVVVFNMVQVTARQRLCPPPLLGRMNASIRFVVWGVMPIAALLAGWCGGLLGAPVTIIIGALIQGLSAVPFLVSRYGAQRELPRHLE